MTFAPPRTTSVLAFAALAALAFTAAVAQSATETVEATASESTVSEPTVSDSTELLFGVITPKCFDAFVQDHDFANVECIKFVVSKLLSYAIITGAFILKLPQILKIVAAKDVTGLTPSSFYMEVVLCASTSAYNLLRGYPLSTWGETLVILVQNLILVLLLWAYHVPTIGYSTRVSLTLLFGVASAAMMLTSPEHQWLLMSASIPVTIVARAPQVLTNFKQGHTGQLAFITLLLNFGGTVARMFTTLQETGDPVQIVGLAVSMALNGLLVLQVVVYWNATTKALAVAVKKKAQ